MNGTLYSLNMLDTPVGFITAGLIGVLFGFFLEQAGFGSSRKLTGMFYFRDMSVLKVMFTAVVVTLVGYRYLVALGWLAPEQVYVLDTYWGAQIVGGLIFGVGFVLGGWCPGTAFVGLASAKWDALVFLIGATLGSVLFNEVFSAVQPLYDGMHAGPLFLTKTLGLSAPLLVLLFCLAAIGAFAGGTKLEARFGGRPLPTPGARTLHCAGALVLVALALLGFALPEPPPSAAPAAASQAAAAGLLAEVAQERDHVEPHDLAAMMMAGDPKLVVVDIRPAGAYAQFHLRGAINVPLEALAPQAAATLPRDGHVVLYSNGTTHAAQAWLELRHMGWSNVRMLTDGVEGFWRDCLTPPSLTGLVDEQSAKAQFEAFAARRAFFLEGTTPTPAVPVAAAAPAPKPMAEPGRARHLVSTEWLASRLNDPRVRIIDARNKSTEYSTAHIPGAFYLHIESIRTTIDGVPSMMAPAQQITASLGRMGVNPRDTVIVYADGRVQDATYTALALERVQHPSYAVLHGGFGKWQAEKRPVTSALPEAKPEAYKAMTGADGFTVGIEAVKAALGDKKTVILDVRPADYFRGDKSDEARPGHIPGAVNREYTLDLVPGSALWQSSDFLRAEYGRLGISAEETPVIVHCRTGHQASQTFFTLKHLLGLRNVRWFDASWTAWAARPDLPAERSR